MHQLTILHKSCCSSRSISELRSYENYTWHHTNFRYSNNEDSYFIGTNFRGEKFSRLFAISRFFSRNSRKFLPRKKLFPSIREIKSSRKIRNWAIREIWSLCGWKVKEYARKFSKNLRFAKLKPREKLQIGKFVSIRDENFLCGWEMKE